MERAAFGRFARRWTQPNKFPALRSFVRRIRGLLGSRFAFPVSVNPAIDFWNWSDVKYNGKTKKVAGVDLNAECFLYSPDLENTSSWIFPVLVRGDEMKTRNLIAMHLHNFDARTAGLSEALRQQLFDMLRGCAITHGLHAERRMFAAKSEASAIPAEPPPSVKPPKMRAEEILIQKELKQLAAMADIRADLFLKQLGID